MLLLWQGLDYRRTKMGYLQPEVNRNYVHSDLQATCNIYSIFHLVVQAPYSYPYHSHPGYFELSMVLKGCQVITIDGKTYEQLPGDITLVLPDQVHKMEVQKSASLEFFVMIFNINDPMFTNWLKYKNENFFPVGSKLNTIISPKLKTILNKFIVLNGPSKRMHILAMVYDLCSTLTDLMENDTPIKPGAFTLAQKIAEKIEVLSTLHSTLKKDENTSIQQIADDLGVSLSYCNRIFHKFYEMSPRQYLSELKLREAKKLLEQDYPILQVAEILGFGDSAQFSRQFKRWTNLSPSAYKKIHRNSVFIQHH